MSLGAASFRTGVDEAQTPGVCSETRVSQVSLLIHRALCLADCSKYHHSQGKLKQFMHT